jgi:hypothetical protein
MSKNKPSYSLLFTYRPDLTPASKFYFNELLPNLNQLQTG